MFMQFEWKLKITNHSAEKKNITTTSRRNRIINYRHNKSVLGCFVFVCLSFSIIVNRSVLMWFYQIGSTRELEREERSFERTEKSKYKQMTQKIMLKHLKTNKKNCMCAYMWMKKTRIKNRVLSCNCSTRCWSTKTDDFCDLLCLCAVDIWDQWK